MSGKKPLFYEKGLRFDCHQCNNCCRGEQPGSVYPSRPEVERIARKLALTTYTFRRRYLVRDSDGDVGFRMKPNGDCIFWDEGCTIYEVRPRQCRTFPFWRENLESPEAWAEARKSCQGVDRGRLYSLAEIKSVLKGRSTGS